MIFMSKSITVRYHVRISSSILIHFIHCKGKNGLKNSLKILLIAVCATASDTPIFDASMGRVGPVILKNAPIVIRATVKAAMNHFGDDSFLMLKKPIVFSMIRILDVF